MDELCEKTAGGSDWRAANDRVGCRHGASGGWIVASTRIGPRHTGHSSTSTANTRRINSAQNSFFVGPAADAAPASRVEPFHG